jgi:integrase
MLYFGLYTGQRLADIGTLTWANLDLGAAEVRVRTGKTGRIVRIPICSPLMAHIESLPAGDDPTARLHPRTSALFERGSGPMVSRQFGDLLATAGLIAKRDHNKSKGKGRGARRDSSELSFHSLRHTATSMMKNAGISPAIVMDIIGHDSAEMSAHYTHIESDAKRKALDSMPDLAKPIKPTPKGRKDRA